MRARIAAFLKAHGDDVVRLAGALVQVPTVHPPGDTRGAVALLQRQMEGWRIPCRVVAGDASRPNLVATIEGSGPGPHLVLNGFLDVFPPGPRELWRHDPFSGEVAGGRLWGRGAASMKGGLAALSWAFYALARHSQAWPGRVTLTAVSDEASFGPWGARYLWEKQPEAVRGDALLNAMPTGPEVFRCGEKGVIWGRITVEGKGSHAAMPHLGLDANRILARITGVASDL